LLGLIIGTLLERSDAVAAPIVTPATRPLLPAFVGAAGSDIVEAEALHTLSAMKRRNVRVFGANVPTSYWESGPTPGPRNTYGLSARLTGLMRTSPMLTSDSAPASLLSNVRTAIASARRPAPRVLLLHGADASCLEWRLLVPKLNALGVATTAVDWWSGGWTDRDALLQQVEARRPDAPKPWNAVQEHLHAFWRDHYDSEPVIVVGASLGGAVALDFAASHPEAVAGLVLVDAGGESYKSPPPDVVSALAPVALGVKRALAWISTRSRDEELRINSLHRSEPKWAEALGAYLASGGYARRVGHALIREQIPQPALVVWGSDDPILPLDDAYAFERDLPGCVGVREVPGCGHTPQLEDPDAVALHVAQFALELRRRG